MNEKGSNISSPYTVLQSPWYMYKLPFCSACERLGLKHSWSQERVVRHVMKKKLKREQVEELLDVSSAMKSLQL